MTSLKKLFQNMTFIIITAQFKYIIRLKLVTYIILDKDEFPIDKCMIHVLKNELYVHDFLISI